MSPSGSAHIECVYPIPLRCRGHVSVARAGCIGGVDMGESLPLLSLEKFLLRSVGGEHEGVSNRRVHRVQNKLHKIPIAIGGPPYRSDATGAYHIQH